MRLDVLEDNVATGNERGRIEIWNWRTKVLLAEGETEMLVRKVRFKASGDVLASQPSSFIVFW